MMKAVRRFQFEEDKTKVLDRNGQRDDSNFNFFVQLLQNFKLCFIVITA